MENLTGNTAGNIPAEAGQNPASAGYARGRQDFTCPSCGKNTVEFMGKPDTERARLGVCPACGFHQRLEPRERIALLADGGSFVEFDPALESVDPIGMPGYPEKLAEAREKTGEREAVVTGKCAIEGRVAIVAVMSFKFIGGSMGSVVGEKISRAMLRGAEERLPVIVFTASGGARMQEGVFSLMQMAKTSAAAADLEEAGQPLFIVLCDPTTGGVTASFAMLGNVTLAEPRALVGFAGARVIENTIKQKIPEDLQKAETQLRDGFVDAIVSRDAHRKVLSYLIDAHRKGGASIASSVTSVNATGVSGVAQTNSANRASGATVADADLEAIAHPGVPVWDRISMARRRDRPGTPDYIKLLFDEFIELSGDHVCGEDASICGGIAKFGDRYVTVIGPRKGKNTEDTIRFNFGMPNPEGYRKALRLAREAELFGRPVITFIDTAGAFPGISAEQHGIGEAIARNLKEFSRLEVPVLCFVIGEGGSGGALALGVADRVYMLENAYYTVITPEGFASILMRNTVAVHESVELMKIMSEDLKEYGLVDGVIPEPEGGAQADPGFVASRIRALLDRDLACLEELDPATLVAGRKAKFRAMGAFKE